jgi:lipopolysaccharide export system permease protein
MRITIIDRFIIRQFLITFFFIMGIVLAIAVLIDFVEKIDDFLDKKPPLKEIVFDYYANFLPYFGQLFSPICIFLAVIFFTSRMASRTEIIPLLTSGTSFYRIMVPYMGTALLLCGLAFYFKGFLVPEATSRRIEFEYKYVRKKKISSTKDIHKKVAQDSFVYIGYYNERKKEGTNFSMERMEKGDIVTRISGQRLVWRDSTQNWRIEQAVVRHIDEDRERLVRRAFIDTTFLLTPDDIFKKEQYQETMILPELTRYIQLEEMRGSDILNELYIERNRRFSDPMAILILTLIGFSMASRKSRGGTALQIGLGLALCFVYIAMLYTLMAVSGDSLTPWQAVWLPNMIFFPISLFLLYRAPK